MRGVMGGKKWYFRKGKVKIFLKDSILFCILGFYFYFLICVLGMNFILDLYMYNMVL